MKPKQHSISKVYAINSTQLFQIVSNFENYDKWNTIIPNAKGKLIVGEKLSLTLKLNNKIKPFKPKVISINNGNSFLLSKILISKKMLKYLIIFILPPYLTIVQNLPKVG